MSPTLDRAAPARPSEGSGDDRQADPAIWDTATDADGPLPADPRGDLARLIDHQTLMRAYQSRYVLLPARRPPGDVLARLKTRYDPRATAALEALRPTLEARLIDPAIAEARAASAGRDWRAHAEALVAETASAPETAFTAFLATSPDRAAHYRHFLLQSSADLLAEASASAFGVIGEFGAPQSALFRVLIDEFGYGAHARKHAVLYQAVMRGFGLPDVYNAGWRWFDASALSLHNTIHCLFQNPGHIFLQVGFLLHAETTYQRSTRDHFRYLRRYHPEIDARYFGEHAHIDLHHTRMVIEEVAAPLVETYGPEVGAEIVAGAELTRRAFDQAGGEMLATAQAFDAAVQAGRAAAAMPSFETPGRPRTPSTARPGDGTLQLGGLGRIEAPAFAAFPSTALARTVAS